MRQLSQVDLTMLPAPRMKLLFPIIREKVVALLGEIESREGRWGRVVVSRKRAQL